MISYFCRPLEETELSQSLASFSHLYFNCHIVFLGTLQFPQIQTF